MSKKAKVATPSLDQYVTELQNTLVHAALNYEIWWVYKDKETRARFTDIMNRYNLFFTTSIHAHFVALMVALYRLYETRDDTYNIPSMLKLLRKEGTLPATTLDQLDALHTAARPLWQKVSTVRNEAFGHRSVKATSKDVFSKAAIRPNDMKALMDITEQFLNEFTLAWNRSTHAFNLNSRDDTIRLLEDLTVHRAAARRS